MKETEEEKYRVMLLIGSIVTSWVREFIGVNAGELYQP